MKIDVHTHIFMPEIVEQRECFFSDEPVFKLLYDSPKARLATAETLLEAMDRDGVDYSVVFGFPWRSADLAARHNDYVLEAASRHAPRLIPMGCVNPLTPGSAHEAERCLGLGAKGLGELAIYSHCDTNEALKRYGELIQCCRSHNGILLVHANEPVGHNYPGKAPLGLDFYYGLAGMASDMILILAHWGGGLCFYELLKKEAPKVLANVYYDTAASPFLYSPAIYPVMAKAVGAEKILFGSDYPLLKPQRYFDEMAGAGLTSEEMEAICGGSAARLLGIPDEV
jgi:hypothetical protein